MARKSALFYWKARKGWYATINGQRSRFGDTKEQAEAPFKAALKQAGTRSAAKGSVAEWADVYLDHKQVTGAEATYKLYKNRLESLCNFKVDNGKLAGNLHITKLRARHVEAWLLSQKTWNNSSRANAITVIKAFVHFLIANKYVHRDDIDLSTIKKPKMGRRQKWISETEHTAILALVKDQQFRDLLNFLYHTGARPKEVYTLRLRHLDLANSRFVIPNAEMPTHKTGGEGKDRIVYLNKESLEIINRLIDGVTDPEAIVFRNVFGNPWTITSINGRFEKLKAPGKLGKRYSPYAYRHGYGTRKIMGRKLPDLTVASLMGHSDLSMLKDYYNHADEAIADMIDAANT